MIQSKKFGIIVVVLMSFALLLCAVLVACDDTDTKTDTTAEYGEQIFGVEMISVEILADEADWEDMLENATAEEYIMADLVINGTKFENVGIRPKGNSSLSQVAQTDSNRYSLRLQFNEYIKDQTCFGLESFVLNNMISDNTYMKEYICYEMMQEIGVEAPYFGYADIKVNGNDWGLYLAVELYNDSYEQRVSRTTAGMLYNVKSMDIGGNDKQEEGGMQMPQDGQMPQMGRGEQVEANITTMQSEQQAEHAKSSDERSGFGGGMGGRGSNGGTLEYSDDNISSYSAIFNNVVGSGTDTDYKRVIEAIKALNEGENIEEYWNVDAILRYLAAHTMVVNLDSYSSNMAQNYYIYENDGFITILPWDYNLAWGGFQNNDADSVINFPIDTPVSGVQMSARPLLETLFANREYLKQYHTYLQEIITNYFADGQFEAKINELDSLIGSYVQNDLTAFCTYEAYQTAVEAFQTLGNLRAESVQGQLDGRVASTTKAQAENPEQLITDDSGLLAAMGGTMNGGGHGDGAVQADGFKNGTMPDMERMNQARQILSEAGGTLTDEVKQTLLELGLTEEEIEMISKGGQGGFSAAGDNSSMENAGQKMQRGSGNHTAEIEEQQNLKQYLIFGIAVLVLLSVTFFVARKKQSY